MYKIPHMSLKTKFGGFTLSQLPIGAILPQVLRQSTTFYRKLADLKIEL